MTSLESRVGILSWDFSSPKTGFTPGVEGAKGGLGRAMRWIAEALASGGIPVAVGTPFASRGLETKSWNEEPLLPSTIHFGGHVLFSALLPLRLREWVAKNTISLLLVPCGPGGVLLWRKPKNVALVAVCHHTYLQQSRAVPTQWWKKIFVPLERRMLRMADRIFCYSKDTCDVLINDYHLSQDRVVELPHIFEIDRWMQWPEEPKQPGLCVCVARLESRKGVAELLDQVWQRVHRQCPSATLVVVGDGIQRRSVDKTVKKYNGLVHRTSSLALTELIPLVKSAELALCPSYLEGFGLAAAEAMASGTTVIGSDVDGLRSLITSGETGWLVAPGDPDALADAIVSLLTNHNLRKNLAEKAQIFVRKRFDRERATQALQHAIRALL